MGVCVCVCAKCILVSVQGEKIACPPEILIKCLAGVGAGSEEHMARARSLCGYLRWRRRRGELETCSLIC